MSASTHCPSIPGLRGAVARIPIGTRHGVPHELRLVQARGMLFIGLHNDTRCISGPLAVPLDAVSTLRSILGDVLGEHGSGAATDPELAATRTPGSGRAIP